MRVIGVGLIEIQAAEQVFRDVTTRRFGSGAFENSLHWIVARAVGQLTCATQCELAYKPCSAQARKSKCGAAKGGRQVRILSDRDSTEFGRHSPSVPPR